MITLIVEFQTSGHYPEYLKHLLAEINEEHKHKHFLIFLSPLLKKHLKPFENLPVFESIHFFDKSLAIEYGNCKNTKQMAKIIFSQIFIIKRKYKFDHVLFSNLNLVLRNSNILNPFKKLPFNFSGILMKTPYRLRIKTKNKLQKIKLELPLQLLIKNKNCSKIWFLNDKKGYDFYKKWSSKISFVVDPVRMTRASELDIYKYHNISFDKIIFLQIGKLGVYKGTLDILSAINFLDKRISKNTHFLFVGKANKDLENNNEAMSTLSNSKLMSLRNTFIIDEDFSAYVEQSHVIIIANKNVENSSGIVNHCLANNKVVIAPDKGYYKDGFKNHNAVVRYNHNDFTLSDAITYTVKNYLSLKAKANNFDSQSFIKNNSSKKFAKTIIKPLV